VGSAVARLRRTFPGHRQAAHADSLVLFPSARLQRICGVRPRKRDAPAGLLMTQDWPSPHRPTRSHTESLSEAGSFHQQVEDLLSGEIRATNVAVLLEAEEQRIDRSSGGMFCLGKVTLV